MPIPPKRKIRGLRNIHTNRDRMDLLSKEHVVYLRIGSLEMEKERLLTERENLVARLNALDDRIGQIEAEKDNLLRIAGERDGLPDVAPVEQDVRTLRLKMSGEDAPERAPIPPAPEGPNEAVKRSNAEAAAPKPKRTSGFRYHY